ncbi:hypothetical protein LAZ67_4000859 [Cordylochernes scorpioides]|uniref:Uncharacterized protein n=1 Tax=Cordylochernes scorpioides TaxID=51811 RepID=A0ABY6KBV8_9ARAC|nr:hypothetical protein LAZ67_4000859 [Cordylochernes scorpioides]
MDAGMWIKCLGLSPSLYWVALVGQTISALSQIFILGIPPQLAATWFGENETSFACSIGIFGNQLGVALGFLVPSLVVTGAYHKQLIYQDLLMINFSVAIFTSFVFVAILFVFEDRPRHPPNMAQAFLYTTFTVQPACQAFRNLLTNKEFILLLLSYGFNAGVFYALSTLLNQMILTYYPSCQDSVHMVQAMIIMVGRSRRLLLLQSQTFTKVCLDHNAMINESCTPIPHSMRSDVDLHAASPVAQNKQGRGQDLASKQLRILQCNINGLCSTATKIKLEEIMEIAEKQKIQIIALQETKLNEKYNLKYKNYNILRKDRNKEGGGLAFLIKNLYYEDIAINIPNTSDLEAQGIKVYLSQNKTINIFNMYHPPNNKLIDDGTMAQFLTDNTIIVGDLNAKHQLWGCSMPNPRGKILSNIFDDNAFMCLNNGNPTHHSYSYNTAQALDISFSSPDIFHKCKWQILKSIGSDHLPILIEISTKTKTSSIKEKFWNFKKANWNLYQKNTNEDFRKAPTRIKDLEQNWISFKNTIIKAAKVSIPRGNIKKWIPNYTHQAKDIQTLITKRNELQKKCTQNQTNCRTELNIVNAKIKRLYVNMKREKWKETCENLNPRNPNTKLWHLAKQIDRAQPQTENTNMIKNTDGTPATNDKNAANLLGNSYQISSKIKFEIKDKKVEKKARKIIHDCKNFTSTHNIFHEKINMKDLDYALENTDLNKTPGPDGIHGQMISNLGKNGKEILLDIFNNSWKTGKLPQDWKTATIIPIKKLDKSADDPKNYRPISLTSICCKLMEKIILRRLTYHLDTRNLLPEEQYGFRKGHGTIDQLLFFTQKEVGLFVHRLLSILLFIKSTVFMALFAAALEWGHVWSLYLIASLLGFEFGAEITYPESEGSSAGLMNASGQGIKLVKLETFDGVCRGRVELING